MGNEKQELRRFTDDVFVECYPALNLMLDRVSRYASPYRMESEVNP